MTTAVIKDAEYLYTVFRAGPAFRERHMTNTTYGILKTESICCDVCECKHFSIWLNILPRSFSPDVSVNWMLEAFKKHVSYFI